MGADPMTSFGDRRIQFYLTADTFETLIEMGDYQLLGMVRSRASIGRHQWFTDVALRKAQREIVVVSANDEIKKFVNSTHLETMRVSVEGMDQHIGQIKTIENEVVVKISKDKTLIGTAHK